MLHGGNMVAKRTWVVVGWCVEVVGGVAGVVVVDLLKKTRHKDVTLASPSTRT